MRRNFAHWDSWKKCNLDVKPIFDIIGNTFFDLSKKYGFNSFCTMKELICLFLENMFKASTITNMP